MCVFYLSISHGAVLAVMSDELLFTVFFKSKVLHNYQNLTLKEPNMGPDLHHYQHNVRLTLFAKH